VPSPVERSVAEADGVVMGDGDGVLGADVVPVRPVGASDVVPVRVGAPPGGRVGSHPVPIGLAGTSIAPIDRSWHPGLDLPPVGGAHRPRWDDRGARRRGSATSFGLTGRIVITVLFLLGLGWVVMGSVFSILGLPPYLIVMAWALRDVWQRVPVASPTPPGAATSATRGQSGSPR
jgi:hypothetical protein